MKRKPIYNAIKAATAMVALTAISSTYAQEVENGELEEVVVTGSNIPRPVSDAPQPITVIDSLDIQLSGFTNTADVLRNSAYNSFGSFRERSGSSFGQIATADLRGLGSQYTAVLINGRRVPGSPFTGASIVDLNTIPISSVERVEILKDGASAVYGADAIGGVISIVLKDDYEGFEVGGGFQSPSLEGGDSENFNVLWGKTGSRGNIIAGAEYFNRDAIFDRDRPYSAAQVNGPTFGDVVGISVGGNTGFETDFSAAFPLGSCDESIYAGIFSSPFGVPGTGCGFAYANRSLQTGNLERKSVFVNGNYEISDSMTAYADVRFNNNETSGRYAPAVGFFPFPSSSPFNTLGRDISAFHRFVGHGDRDDSVELDELTIIGGLKGEFKNGIGYDFWGQWYEYDALERGNTYIQTSVLVEEVVAGRYDVFNPLSQDPTHLEAIARSGVELTRDINTSYRALGATFNGTFGEMAGGEIGWAAGAEWADEDYQDIYDEFREALDVLGSAGNSAEGERDRTAVFAEVRLPVLDNLEVNIAGRYDDYDIFGSEFSPQINAKFTLNENLSFRASLGEGFKAPDLTNLFVSQSESFNDIRDQFRFEAQGNTGTAPAFQVQNFSQGNPLLKAESSESFNIGVIADIGGFSASLDYYKVEIEDQITRLSLGEVNALEAQGALPAGVVVNRAPTVDGVPGTILNIVRPFVNAALVQTDGIDLNANLAFESGIGNWDLDMQWVHILNYELQNSPDDTLTDIIGGSSTGGAGYPENRVNTRIRLNRGDLTFSLNSQFIDSFENPTEDGDYESWFSHDLTVNWANAFNIDGLEFTAGVQNITEETPSIDSNGTYDDSIVLTTYDPRGRIPFINFRYSPGQ
ncbi:MAG: TonB-dependent receptor [Gammaproteobacteria bacterium]|nr:TonB-dependent receptor [Gammaproteobacteria bacterium]